MLSKTDEFTKQRRLERTALQAPAHARPTRILPPKHRKAKQKASLGSAEQPWYVRIYTGVEMNPLAVSITRQVLYLLLSAAISFVLAYFRDIPPLGNAANFTIILTLCNGLQGLIDQYLKGNASATPPTRSPT